MKTAAIKKKENRNPQRANKNKMLPHVVGFIVCVLLPAFVTVIAPVTRLHLAYDGKKVSASATWFLYLAIPYRTTRLSEVISTDSRWVEGEWGKSRDASGRSRRVKTEDTASLILAGPESLMEIPVSPVNLDAAMGKVQAFLDHPTPEGLSLITVANWKFSVGAGGFLSLFTLLYGAGVIISCVKWLKRFIPKSGPGR